MVLLRNISGSAAVRGDRKDAQRFQLDTIRETDICLHPPARPRSSRQTAAFMAFSRLVAPRSAPTCWSESMAQVHGLRGGRIPYSELDAT